MSEQMSGQLRDVLRRIGEEQPSPRLPDDLYGRGVRARRRRTAGSVLAGGVAVLLMVGGAAGITRLDREAPPPASGSSAPALPETLYAVPERLVSHAEEGSSWDERVSAPDLAVGPTGVVLSVSGLPMAVSALDGSYRGLTLPGFDERGASFRLEEGATGLSPDGTRLAYTWNPAVVGQGFDRETPSETGVRVADLEDGTVEDFPIPSAFGVYTHRFVWSPDGRFLMYGLQVVTSPDGTVSGSRNFTTEILDTRTGDRTRVPQRIQRSGPLVVGDDGKARAAAVDSGEVMRVLGQTATDGLVRLRSNDAEAEVWVEVTRPGEDPRRVLEAGQAPDPLLLSVATGLVDSPTRAYPEPDWPTDWGAVTLRATWAAVALFLLVLVGLTVRRRRRRNPT